jgi:hypothetical protein
MNGQLASVPDAARIAFDPVRHRVWRICSDCGEWNLLGPEASEAALPELSARFAARTSAGEAPAAFAPVRLGTVELIKIGAPESGEESLAFQLQREVDKRSRMYRLTYLMFGGLGFIYIVIGYVGFGSDPWKWIFMLSEYSLTAPLLLLDRWLANERVTRWTWAITISVVVALQFAIGGHEGIAHVRIEIVGMAFATPLVLGISYAGRRWFPLAHGFTRYGRLVPISRQDVRHLTIDWTHAGELMICGLRDDQMVVGDHAIDLYHHLWPWISRTAPGKPKLYSTRNDERAAELLRAVGGLRGLFHALDGFRADQDGRIELAKLPWIYLAALEFALKVDGHDDGSGELRSRALAASTVADEAEALDP